MYILSGSFEPHLLVQLAFSLAVAGRFPEELVREIFSMDFLGKLDFHLECMSPVKLFLKIENNPFRHVNFCTQKQKQSSVYCSRVHRPV